MTVLTLAATMLACAGTPSTQTHHCTGSHCRVNTQFLAQQETQAINGRLYVSHTLTTDNLGQRITREDAAARYGAAGAQDSVIHVRVPGLFHFEHGGYVTAIDPWQPVKAANVSPYSNPFSNANRKLASKVEAARQQWLKDNNWVGGVRTFMNDAALEQPTQHANAEVTSKAPQPRAVIELAPDAPRLKSKMRVQAAPAKNNITVAGSQSSKATTTTKTSNHRKAEARAINAQITKVITPLAPKSAQDTQAKPTQSVSASQEHLPKT